MPILSPTLLAGAAARLLGRCAAVNVADVGAAQRRRTGELLYSNAGMVHQSWTCQNASYSQRFSVFCKPRQASFIFQGKGATVSAAALASWMSAPVSSAASRATSGSGS